MRLGRLPAAGWAVPWDQEISREHVELQWRDGRLLVHKLAGARNPIFFRGQAVEQLSLDVGEGFVIGMTSFRLTEDESTLVVDGPAHPQEQTFGPGDLEQVEFRNADHRLEVLSRLPQGISGPGGAEDFYLGLVSLLLAGIPHAEAAALVRQPPAGEPDADRIEVIHWDRRRPTAGRFQPSRRLVFQAIGRDESVLYVWSDPEETEFTISENLEWAFCTPVPGEACRGWGLYVAGTFGRVRGPGMIAPASRDELQGDLRFAELFAQLIGALRQVRWLERQRARLGQFFSPTVLETILRDRSGQALDPKETEVTVLFCDLRGFSREAEQWRHNLPGLLQRVSAALSMMTHAILKYGGVIGDVQGDAAMGFWGWPVPSPEGQLPVCKAALEISAQFQQAAQRPEDPLANFQVGIGIAHGRAVAGRIGTTDQVKVSVFGPVVNLASRLEGMTRQLRAAILLDEVTAGCVRQILPKEIGRCRRLGRIRPYGMHSPLMVSELLPPAEKSLLTDRNVEDYESAVDSVLAGRWPEALELLGQLPPRDRAKDFLTVFIAQHNYEPPPNWDGVIPMPSK